MEIRRLTAKDYDQLLETLNTVFGNKSKLETDFLNEQPKMWIRDDTHMGYHLGMFDGDILASVVGIYPLPVRIAGEKFMFYTTGNVATRPEYEGQGCLRTLFTMAMDYLEEVDADAARLGGQRQRYARYGFEPGGTSFKVTLSAKNRIQYYQDAGADITFREIAREDRDALAFCARLSRQADIYVERSDEDHYRDTYLALGSKHAGAYLALRGGKPVGYLAAKTEGLRVGKSQNGKTVLELRTQEDGDFIPMVCAWQRHVQGTITLSLPMGMARQVAALSPGAESVSIVSPSRFKIRNIAGIANALMQLKAREPLPLGEVVLGIRGYGNLRLYVTETAAGCEKTLAPAQLTLDRAQAARVLFGHLPIAAEGVEHPLLRAWLPLPLSWDTLDYV